MDHFRLGAYLTLDSTPYLRELREAREMTRGLELLIRGPKLSSQSPHESAQPFVTSVKGTNISF